MTEEEKIREIGRRYQAGEIELDEFLESTQAVHRKKVKDRQTHLGNDYE